MSGIALNILHGMLRRVAVLVAAVSLLLCAVALAMTASIAPNAGAVAPPPTVPYYQCISLGSGAAEAGRAGIVVPKCGNKTDPIKTWSVAPFQAATTPTSTTTSPVTSTVTTGPPGATTSTSSPGGTTPTTVPTTTTTVLPAGLWRPTATNSISWYWQLQGTVALRSGVQVYDVDGFDTSAATVTSMHAAGARAICYMDLGTNEPGRPDANLIPAADNGNSVQGFASEHWLNVADLNGLKPMINNRLSVCAQKGFDAVEPDDVDGYTNSTGFSISAAQQLAYNEYIAQQAHADGLSVGLKNDVDQASTLQPFFDWALNEQCNEFSECGTLQSFTKANKAIFNAEYSGGSTFCTADAKAQINGALFNIDLDGKTFAPCPSW